MSSQPLQALERANAARAGVSRIRHAIKRGELTVAQALEDPDAGPAAIATLLEAQRGWGALAAERLCRRVPVRTNMLVREMTDRQRAVVGRLAGDRP